MPGAASIKDVNFSQRGEAELKQPFAEQEASQMAVAAAPERVTGGKRVIFKLTDTKKNGRLWIDGIDDVINPTTKEPDRLRLLRGIRTIWQSEQKNIDPKFVDKNRISLLFENKVCVLDEKRSASIIEFARLSNHFIGNPNRIKGSKHEFFEWNPAAQEREALAKEMLEIEVMQLAMAQPFDKLKKHAAFIGGISFNDELGEARTEEGIRTLYIREAKRRPEIFKKTLDSKEVEVSYLIKKAIIDSKIDLGGKSGTISWASGGFICKLPMSRVPQEYLTELAMLPNEEGKQFLEHLQKTVV